MKKESGNFKVTPWDVSGEVNYNKLTKQFGVSPLKSLPDVFNKNHLYRRKIIFAHRDIQRILDAVKNKKPFAMMTGLVPTGKFHIGHMMLAKEIVFWQSLKAKIYIAVADLEAYNARGVSLEKSKKIAVEEYIKNYIALGLKPKNCEIYFQSNRSKDSKKSNAYYRLQNIAAKHTTFNELKAVYGEISPGKILSSLIQASDMLHPQLPEFSPHGQIPVIIPVGIDQDPHLRLARDISQRIKNPKLMQLSSTYLTFIPSLRGGGKMSASEETSFIALTDSPEVVEKKVKKYAFSGGKDTLDEHRKKGGNPDIDVSYQYLRMLFEPDDKKLQTIHDDYRSGKLTTADLKEILIKKINIFLKEHQRKHKRADRQVSKFI